MSRDAQLSRRRPDRCDPVGHQGRAAAWRPSEHGPGLERRRPAALLPDQPARRPPLPAGRPPALPGRGRDRRRSTSTVAGDAASWGGQRAGARSGGSRPVRPRPATARRCRHRPTRSTAGAPSSSTCGPARSVARSINAPGDPDEDARARVREPSATRYGHHLVAIWEVRGDRLVAARRRRRRPGAVDRPAARSTCRARSACSAAPWRSPPAATGAAESASADPSRRRAGRSLTSPSCRTAEPELAAAIPGADGPWGALLVVGETRGIARPRVDRDLVAGRRRRPRRRSSASPAAGRASATCSTAPRRSAASPATSAAGSTSTGSWPASSTTRWCCSRAIAPPSSSSRPDGRVAAEVSRGLSPAYLNGVRDFPARSLPAAAVAARRPLFAVGYRDDPRGERRPGRGRPGGLRHARAPRRSSTAPSCSGCSTSTTTSRTRGPPTSSTRWRRWRPRRASRSGPPRTTSRWRPGRPSSSRSSSSARA